MKRFAFSLFVVVFLATTAQAVTLFQDNFAAYTSGCMADGQPFGEWILSYHGYGCVKLEKGKKGNYWLHQSPQASTQPSETHASMVLGPYYSGAFTYIGRLRTVKHLRTGSTPNPWEVAWVVWNHTDDSHFYYFIPKPNGWELGKVDPLYPGAQRFLATGSTPKFPVGNWYDFQIRQDTNNKISVWMNGLLITNFTDTESPYESGRIGLYNEDAHVHFDNIRVERP